MENKIQMNSPVGPLTLIEKDGAITHLLFGECRAAGEKAPILKEAARQLGEYVEGGNSSCCNNIEFFFKIFSTRMNCNDIFQF